MRQVKVSDGNDIDRSFAHGEVLINVCLIILDANPKLFGF